MAQTPAQRKANAKYAKLEEEKRGKPLAQQKRKDGDKKSPISIGWFVLLAVVVCGGVLVEVIRLWF